MSRNGGTTVVVLDNGAGFCKAGIAGQDRPAVVVPNCLGRARGSKKWLPADLLQECEDAQGMSLRRPLDRGYLTLLEAQKEVWERIFKHLLKVKPAECTLLLVEPLFNLAAIQKMTDELVFQEFGFHSLYVSNGPALAHLYETSLAPAGSFLARSGCSVMLDCGFSFCHAVPVFQGFVLKHGVKRLNLGGKALTNYLKELVSYRAWNVMDETYLMEDVKEKLCFCSLDVMADLEVARRRGRGNYLRCQYVLPDGIKHKRGFVKDALAVSRAWTKAGDTMDADMGKEAEKEQEGSQRGRNARDSSAGSKSGIEEEQELTLTNERFLVPEMLFRPADLGMDEAGLAECIVKAVSACHSNLHPLLYSSVILTGGSTLFPGFKERLEHELRPLVPQEFELIVHQAENPIESAWRGGSLLGASDDFQGAAVTKKEYEEYGSLRCRRRFLQ